MSTMESMAEVRAMRSGPGQRFKGFRSQGHSDSSQRTDLDDVLGQTIEAWLLHSYPPVSGESTAIIYHKILTSLRLYLRSQGLDLDSQENLLIPQIQIWASQRATNSKRQGNVAQSTYNQRISAISSFYNWAREHGVYNWSNPAEKISRTAVHKYAGAQALDVRQVSHQLKQIDRATPRGQRDYVLLQVALNTGRSARELASLIWESLSFDGKSITLTFAGGRSGKIMSDTLDSRLSQTLLAYLQTIYGENLADCSPQAPIWISFSDRTYGQAIGPQTIADICETHLGISQIHKLRHTFALAMDQLGAEVSTIQTRLGHASRATTGKYLASLKQAYNPHATALADAFGIE